MSIIAGETHDCPPDSMTAYGLVLIGDRWYIDTVIRGTIFKNLTIESIKPLPVPSWINQNTINTQNSTPKRGTPEDDRTIIIISFILKE